MNQQFRRITHRIAANKRGIAGLSYKAFKTWETSRKQRTDRRYYT